MKTVPNADPVIHHTIGLVVPQREPMKPTKKEPIAEAKRISMKIG